jgi:hypothetical protein
MKVKSGMLAVTLAVMAIGVTASSAAAQGLPLPPLPGLPGLPALPENPVVGTGDPCGAGVGVVNLGGTTVCALPDSPQLGAAPACPEGSISATVSGQALVCVLPTNTQAPGATGANGATGSSAPPAPPTPVTAAPTPVPQRAPSTTKRKVYKPTLKLTKRPRVNKRLRGSARGLVRSSTKRIVLTTIGRRHGRVVRFTKQFSLKRSGPATAARPYAARVRITFKTKGRVRIRITSRGGGAIKTATFKRTVRAP